MTKKRRNNGRTKNNRGRVKRIQCVFSNKLVPKDKIIIRYVIRNIIEISSMKDVQEACVYEVYCLPKIYLKNTYSIEAAIHNKIIKIRSKEKRKIRHFFLKKKN